MELNFEEALQRLGAGAIVRIAAETPTPAEYLLATIMPERPVQSYTVKALNMTVKAVMAGLAGMDSPYPTGGMVSVSSFMEESAKIANSVPLNEETLRQLQNMMLVLAGRGASTNERLVNEMLNFFEKAVLQAHWDTMEFLRGQALSTGALDWKYNGKHLSVDYGIPVGNKLANRTGNDAYGGSASKFWSDVHEIQKLLKYNVLGLICSTNLLQTVLANDVNKVEVTSQNGNVFTLSRLVGNNDRRSSDSRDSITIVTYDREGEIINPANVEQTIRIPFLTQTKLIGIGRAERSGYIVGQGSTPSPEDSLALGYTHIAPTVEGGGMAGRWGRLYTPQGRPYQLVGEGVTNGLPVIEAPDKLVIASTDLPA